MTTRPRTGRFVERDCEAHLRIPAELLVRAIATLELMWIRLELRWLGTPVFDEVLRAEAMFQYVIRQPDAVQPGVRSGIVTHRRP